MSLRVPAEWEPHAACITAWPHLESEWRHKREESQTVISNLVRALAPTEDVKLIVPSPEVAQTVPDDVQALAELLILPYGDVWVRDTGPIGVSLDGQAQARRFSFNGWGNKYLFNGDATLAKRLCEHLDLPNQACPMVLEGGALDFDGEGTVVTTRQCTLNPNRNPGMDDRQVEELLLDSFGVERVLWLKRGLAGDHTDGHIDNICRFVRPATVMMMGPSSASDPHRDVLDELLSSMGGMRDGRDRPIEIIDIPSPGAVLDDSGAPLPASYLNFYIGNDVVIVPLFSTPHDNEALDRIGTAFPNRRVVGLDARPLLFGGGAFHCVTQQIPRLP